MRMEEGMEEEKTRAEVQSLLNIIDMPRLLGW